MLHGDAKSEELAVLKNEFEWLLSEELPSILIQLKELLQSCLQKFKTRAGRCIGDIGDESYKGNNFLLQLPNSDAVKGLINITGYNVIKAELRLKFPKISSGPIGTFIFEQCPWKLQQLQDTCNDLKMAYEEIVERESCGSLTRGQHVVQLMDKVMRALGQAKSSLIVPQKPSIPDLMAFNSQVLNPPIADELVLSFHVNCDKLVLAVYVLNTLTTVPHQKSLQRDHMGQVFEYKNKWYEVVNKHEVICAVPWVKDLIVWINNAQQLCQQMNDKIAIFSALLPDENAL